MNEIAQIIATSAAAIVGISAEIRQWMKLREEIKKGKKPKKKK